MKLPEKKNVALFDRRDIWHVKAREKKPKGSKPEVIK